MEKEKYMEMLYVFNKRRTLIIEWSNSLKVRCESFTGICETDTEPGDEDYIGEYSAGVDKIEILNEGTDDSVRIYDNSMEISLLNIPAKISLEDGTVLWQRESE